MKTTTTLPRRLGAIGTAVALSIGLSAPARAQIPVTDALNLGISVESLAQDIQQVMSWVQQYQQMIQQLQNQAQQIQNATGNRGMERLLMGAGDQAARRYLPQDLNDIYQIYSGGIVPGYGAISARITSLRSTISSLPPGFFPAGSQAETALNKALDLVGTQRSMAEQSYRSVTDRIGSTENLIATIGSTVDEKGISELQARIQGEQVLAQNEANRISLLAYQQRIAQFEKERRDLESLARTAKTLGTTPFTSVAR